ncbi:MAG TPA: GNAT family N-acetyltransferase [Nevskiaceae bacterium]
MATNAKAQSTPRRLHGAAGAPHKGVDDATPGAVAAERLGLHVRRLCSLDEVGAADWDACFPEGDPFAHHAFLAALERHGCASPRTGWTPAHVVVEDASGRLVAAAPAWFKTHSWGEFVFDFSWAQAAERAGIRYYPKLVCAIPFTPVTGPRLGVRAGTPAAEARRALVNGLREAAQAEGVSSLHALFLRPAERDVFLTAGCEERRDIQFHWYNESYRNFTDFLAVLRHDRRKKILRERRRISDAGLTLRWDHGSALSDDDWRSVYELYAHTYLERGEYPYLSFEFFLDYARQPADALRIVSVHDGTRRVAAAIFLEGGDTLYGRHWGAAAYYDSLHFETCYYQGIEYCITHGLQHFDAGAQGAHKLVRGFVPRETLSVHWLANPRLAAAVARSLDAERPMVDARREALDRYLPYRETVERKGTTRAPAQNAGATQRRRHG